MTSVSARTSTVYNAHSLYLHIKPFDSLWLLFPFRWNIIGRLSQMNIVSVLTKTFYEDLWRRESIYK